MIDVIFSIPENILNIIKTYLDIPKNINEVEVTKIIEGDDL